LQAPLAKKTAESLWAHVNGRDVLEVEQVSMIRNGAFERKKKKEQEKMQRPGNI
jgi:hypothetical protein